MLSSQKQFLPSFFSRFSPLFLHNNEENGFWSQFLKTLCFEWLAEKQLGFRGEGVWKDFWRSKLPSTRFCEKKSEEVCIRKFASGKWKMTGNYAKVSQKMLSCSWWESSLPIFILVWEDHFFLVFFLPLAKKRVNFVTSPGKAHASPSTLALLPRAPAPIWWPLRLMGLIPTRLMRSRLLWRFTVPAKRIFLLHSFISFHPKVRCKGHVFRALLHTVDSTLIPLSPVFFDPSGPWLDFFSGAFLYFVRQTIYDPPFTTPRVIIGQGRGGEERHSGEGI